MEKTFQSTSAFDGYPGFRERSGERVTVVRALTEDEVDLSEVGPMFHIRFADGTQTSAFEDELTE